MLRVRFDTVSVLVAAALVAGSVVGGGAVPVRSPVGLVAVSTFAPPPPVVAYGDGAYRVGVDILPGRYAANGGPLCAWARRSTPPAPPPAAVAIRSAPGPTDSDGMIGGGFGVGHVVVTIVGSDHRFDTIGCGPWVPVVELE